MENRLKSYSICPSLPPFLTSISIFSLSLVVCFFSFSFQFSPLSSILSFNSFPSSPFIPFFLSFLSFLSFLLPSFSVSNYSVSSLPFLLCPLKIALLLLFYAQFIFHSSWSSSSLSLPTFFFHIFPFFLLSVLYCPFYSYAENDITVIISHR